MGYSILLELSELDFRPQTSLSHNKWTGSLTASVIRLTH